MTVKDLSTNTITYFLINRENWAEAHVQIISDILEGNLVTKQDLKNLEIKFDTSIDRLDKKIDSIAERVEHKILQSE